MNDIYEANNANCEVPAEYARSIDEPYERKLQFKVIYVNINYEKFPIGRNHKNGFFLNYYNW